LTLDGGRYAAGTLDWRSLSRTRTLD